MLNGNNSNEKKRLYGDIDEYVTIWIQGKAFQVPKGLELLRCFQYLEFDIAFENFCWNASCENCACPIAEKSDAEFERTLCCQEVSDEGLCISDLPMGVEIPKK